MVFNIQPLADENHQTTAAVVNKAGDKGASIQFDTRQLPVLTLWKNTDTVKQGLCHRYRAGDQLRLSGDH